MSCVAGRAVAKKGYDTLLSALSAIPPDINWRFVHVSGGPLTSALKKQARSLGLEQRIDWLGAQEQSVVIDTLKDGQIFVLACRIGDDGDRDGLSNVLMEAQSQHLPCISTDISAIPEFIVSGTTGILVAPDDPQSLAQAMIELIASPARCRWEKWSSRKCLFIIYAKIYASRRGDLPRGEAICR